MARLLEHETPSPVKPGLRLQLLLLIGGLLIIGLLPLYFAVSTYTRVTLQQVRYSSARALGRAVAAHVGEASQTRAPSDLMDLLRAEVGATGLEAIAIYNPQGKQLAKVGETLSVSQLPGWLDVKKEQIFSVTTAYGPAIAIAVPNAQGAVIAVLRTDDDAARAAPLLRLFALYTLTSGLVLLVVGYFALTHLIVRPLDQLGRATSKVVSGARKLELPRSGARELGELGASIKQMTEHLLAEEEALRRKIDELQQATHELQAAQAGLVRSERLASVGRLAAGLAHEIGNPIAALIGLQDLLIEGGLEPAEQEDFLKRMRKETERIHQILRDLLQFARPNAPQQLPQSGGSIAQAVEDTLSLLAPQKNLRELELITDLAAGLPTVRLGQEALLQVLLNLLLNAADASEAGGKITITARPTGSGALLSVSDEGAGVAPDIQDQLFEPFVTTKDVGKGTGLGLSVCRGLVEAAGGKIELDPEFHTGARFVIELPSWSPPDSNS